MAYFARSSGWLSRGRVSVPSMRGIDTQAYRQADVWEEYYINAQLFVIAPGYLSQPHNYTTDSVLPFVFACQTMRSHESSSTYATPPLL
jgi:hypothetical protein